MALEINTGKDTVTVNRVAWLPETNMLRIFTSAGLTEKEVNLADPDMQAVISALTKVIEATLAAQ